jgi:phage/plasmid-associated DNA primase
MENEVLFGTTEKINILFKLLFFSNNLMNFDADQGIKRRMIAMEFTTIFADAEELEEKKATYPNSAVFVKDMKLLETFKNNDDYKNAFLNLIVEKAKLYFEKGLIIPDASRTATNELCDENKRHTARHSPFAPCPEICGSSAISSRRAQQQVQKEKNIRRGRKTAPRNTG